MALLQRDQILFDDEVLTSDGTLEVLTRRVLHPSGLELLAMTPQAVQRDPVLRAVYDVAGREFDRLYQYADEISRNLSPATADLYIEFWERLLGIAPDDSQPIEDRRDTVLAYMSRSTMDGSGQAWVAVANLLIRASWRYRVHDALDPTSPDPNVINVYIPFEFGSSGARQIENLLRSITPANSVLFVFYSQGFTLDTSQLDFDSL